MRREPVELLVWPVRAASWAGVTEQELTTLRRRGAGPRWRRYRGGALYSTADLDGWCDTRSEPRWASNAA